MLPRCIQSAYLQDSLGNEEMSEECAAEVVKDQVRTSQQKHNYTRNLKCAALPSEPGRGPSCWPALGALVAPTRPRRPSRASCTPQRTAAADFRLNFRLHQACQDDAQALCAGEEKCRMHACCCIFA